MKLFSKLSILDRYIINELISTFIFGVTICSSVGELIGISFEQMRFILYNDLLPITSIYIHLLKLPNFISISLPFAMLMAAILVYERLARNNEIIALQSCGINLYRLITPALMLGLLLALITFLLNETIVPSANYQAAIILEKALNVERNSLAKYQKKDIIYREFTVDQQQNLKLLVFADAFKNNQLQHITVLNFENKNLVKITVAEIAQWQIIKRNWSLENGQINLIDRNGNYGQQTKFEQISLDLPESLLAYTKHDLDLREMTIWQLWQRLELLEKISDYKAINQVKIAIQERIAIPLSCIIFSFLGSSISIKFKNQSANGFGITIIAIFSYHLFTFITVTLAHRAILSSLIGVWFPNFLLLMVSLCLLHRRVE